MTGAEASQAHARLNDFQALLSNQAWLEEIAPFLETRGQQAINGLRERNLSAEKRSEWLEASHTVDELIELPAKRIGELRDAIQQWSDEQKVLDITHFDPAAEFNPEALDFPMINR